MDFDNKFGDIDDTYREFLSLKVLNKLSINVRLKNHRAADTIFIIDVRKSGGIRNLPPGYTVKMRKGMINMRL